MRVKNPGVGVGWAKGSPVPILISAGGWAKQSVPILLLYKWVIYLIQSFKSFKLKLGAIHHACS
jgi:hypothetical protein